MTLVCFARCYEDGVEVIFGGRLRRGQRVVDGRGANRQMMTALRLASQSWLAYGMSLTLGKVFLPMLRVKAKLNIFNNNSN